ncbi:MAG: type II toxin-antitoxin system HicA family toxin [Ferruginibacter sp.]
MNQSPHYLMKFLEANGILLKRSKGSHHIFFNATSNTAVIVLVHKNKDMKNGTLLALLKQAGIDKNEF